MATYTPALLIVPSTMPISTSISSWRKQNTGATGTFDIHRTTSFSQTGSNTVSVQVGATGAETGTQAILNAFVCTPNVPSIFNWWIAVPGASYFQGFASTGAGVIAESSGYNFA